MLNIYYGRESVDKEKFIYEEITRRGFSASSPVIVLVPDQYTLEAERQAFRFTGKDALIGLDVYSISRLGHNVLSKVGQGNIQFIDKYGRQMLLTGIMADLKDDLLVYGGNVRKPSFIEMINDYISSLKQYDVSPEALEELASGLHENDVLGMKMRDISKIYSEYDKAIKGKYTDSEDYVDLFISRAEQSEMLARSSVWVYGFDSFAPKAMKVLGMLMKLCPEVNAVLTYDRGSEDEALFDLTGQVIENLRTAAEENGAQIGVTASIKAAFPDGRYDVTDRAPEIMHIEHELFSAAPRVMRTDGKESITVTEAANYYNEAETAASFILHLIRDKGYRYRDIAVVCNDTGDLQAALARAFDEYGIPSFLDKKRSISESGAAAYVISMITACVRGMRTRDIIRTLKTGLSVLDQDETEKLENYAISYKIDRNRWKKKFSYGAEQYGEEGLAELEEYRSRVMDQLGRLEAILKKKQSTADFLSDLYRFLTEDAGLTVRLSQLMEAQEEAGLRDLAEETRQIWKMMIGILDQINNIMGETPFDAEVFLQLFTVGLKQAEIGLMPTSPDDLVIGTMQRTRVGRVKAVVVVGANDGIIPQGGATGGLFAEQEDERLAETGFEACRSEQVRRQEERLAIYRNFSKPEAELWISYTAADQTGGQLRPSELIEDILRIFPDVKVRRDILNTGRAEDLISGKTSTLRHMTEAFVQEKNGLKKDPVWDEVMHWYRVNEPETAAVVTGGLKFQNKAGSIGRELADIMFSGSGRDSLSVSRLERYAKCPFAFYVQFGLKPEERQIFEAGSREIGDVYHESLMEITQKLTNEGSWDTITPEEIKELARSTVRAKREDFGGGVLGYSGGDSYLADRAEQTVENAVNVLVSHARAGKIQDSRYEEEFGRQRRIRPIEIDAGGRKIYIEGKIDRLDVLENGRVKIMDYKSGHQDFTDPLIRAGYSLQLMLYLKAAEEGVREPAGVFYFYLGTKGIDAAGKKDVDITGDADPERISELRDASMRGLLVNDPETISEVLGDDETGRIASIRRKKDGEYTGADGSAVLDEGSFRDLQDAVDSKIEELVQGINDGKIDIRPMRQKRVNLACRYCEYKGICRFDTGFRGCTFNIIK